jgi:hypothetical protein
VSDLFQPLSDEEVKAMQFDPTANGWRPRTSEGTVATGAHIDLATILSEVERFLRRFVVFQSRAQSVAVTLWVAHCYAIRAAHATPYLAITSPHKESGKSRLLEVLVAVLGPRAVLTPNTSEAALFRLLDQQPVALLFDETDAIFSARG